MKLDQFRQKVETTQERLSQLSQSPVPESTAEDLLTEIIADFSVCLEELEVALEEISQQNQELMTTRQAVEQERQRYQELFEFAPDGYLVTDSRGVIQEVNQAAVSLLGVPRRTFLIGKPLVTFVVDDERRTFRNQLNQLTASKQRQAWEMKLQSRQGAVFPALVSTSTIQDACDRVVGLRWLIRDLTEQKQAEHTQRQLVELRELNELKSRFMRTASHEIRNPLNMIVLAASLLERSNQRIDPHNQHLLLQKIQQAARTITKLIEDVLTLSKAEANKLRFRPSPLDLEQFCRTLVEEQRLIVGPNRDIAFVSSGEGFAAHLDEHLLHQILFNLMTNALKYSSADSRVEVELTTRRDGAVIQVRDKGIGIPAEDQDKLFEPFHRASNAMNFPGIGLGLSVVKEAVELQGGTITVNSAVGQGTTFTVTLPLKSTALSSRPDRAKC